MARRRLRVLVATPLGAGGRGGIDRMMDTLMRELAANPRGEVEVTCRASRGGGSIVLSPIVLVSFCLHMVFDRLRGRVDVVHINLASSGSSYRKLIISGLARMIGLPVVIHLHGGGMREFWAGSPAFIDRQLTAMIAGAARVVVLGRLWADFIRERVPEAAGRIEVLPNATPVPAERKASGVGPAHIVFLGRLGPGKGTPDLITALGALPDDLSWRATLAGDGDIEETAAHIRRLGLGDRIAVPGWTDTQAIAELLASADMLVLPSHVENLPMVVIEAMAAGVAVIATPVGSTGDIVADGKTGVLVPPGDAEALACALKQMLCDTELRARLAEAGQKLHRERLDIGPYADRLIAIWAQAAGRLTMGASFSVVRQ